MSYLPVNRQSAEEMIAIFTGTLEAAEFKLAALKARGIYATISGNKLRGYDVLVRDAVVKSLQTAGPLFEILAGGNA